MCSLTAPLNSAPRRPLHPSGVGCRRGRWRPTSCSTCRATGRSARQHRALPLPGRAFGGPQPGRAARRGGPDRTTPSNRRVRVPFRQLATGGLVPPTRLTPMPPSLPARASPQPTSSPRSTVTQSTAGSISGRHRVPPSRPSRAGSASRPRSAARHPPRPCRRQAVVTGRVEERVTSQISARSRRSRIRRRIATGRP